MTTAPIRDTPVDATSNVAELLPRVSDGDSAAWEQILRRYGRLVSATVRSFRLQEADALDAVQTTWLRLAENVHRVRHPERLGAWLTTTARRECLRILRQVTTLPKLAEMALETVADPSMGPEHSAIQADTTQRLWEHVDALPSDRSALLRALFAEHPRPYTEIANTAGIPSGGIGPTRARALRQLRDRLNKHEPRDEAWR
jgi:RNA polymerase sigma factor (sigma-70 family)